MVPLFLSVASVVVEPIRRRILPRDAVRPEEDVPHEKQIAVVPLVQPDAVVLRECVMRVVRGGRGDRALQHPRQRM